MLQNRQSDQHFHSNRLEIVNIGNISSFCSLPIFLGKCKLIIIIILFCASTFNILCPEPQNYCKIIIWKAQGVPH